MNRNDRSTLVLLAGGSGKRMGGAINDRPKHLLNIADKPLLLSSVERLITAFNVGQLVFRVAFKADLFVNNWQQGQYPVSVPSTVMVGNLADGPIGAMVSCLRFLDSRTVVFAGGDIYYDEFSFEQMLQFHKQQGTGFTVGVAKSTPSRRPSTLRVGFQSELIEFSRKELTGVEDLINASLYLVDPGKAEWLIDDYERECKTNENLSEYKEDHLWRLLLNRPDRAKLFVLPGMIVNVNSPEDLAHARSLAEARRQNDRETSA
jgi:NDP-sugar pyrophosphorylase family protein